MWRNLSLNKRKDKKDILSEDQDILDLTENSDIKTQNKEMDLEMEENLTQIDLRNTSMGLNVKSKVLARANEDEIQEIVKKIEEVFEKRHHVATLLYSIESCKQRNVMPKFMSLNLELFPYFGSSSTRDYFMDKLKLIRKKLNDTALNELKTACEDLVDISTSKAEHLKEQIIEKLDSSNSADREKISKVQGELIVLIEKWDKKYNDYVTEYNQKIETPLKAPGKSGNYRRDYNSTRNNPYRRK